MSITFVEGIFKTSFLKFFDEVISVNFFPDFLKKNYVGVKFIYLRRKGVDSSFIVLSKTKGAYF